MTDWNDDTIRQIVVGFDSDWQSRQWLLDGAAREAARREIALTLVTVRPHGGGPDGTPSDGVQALQLLYPRLSIRGLTLGPDELRRDRGPLRGTELLIIGSRGRSQEPAFEAGSISRSLLEALACPVLLLPAAVVPRHEEAWQQDEGYVLVGIGADPYDLGVAQAGLEEATRRHCDLHLLFSHPPASGRSDQAELSRPWDLVRASAAGPEGSTPQLSVILTSQPPADALLHHAANATVVVVGTRPGALAGLVPESVSHALLTSVHCPVLVVPRDAGSPPLSQGRRVTAGLS